MCNHLGLPPPLLDGGLLLENVILKPGCVKCYMTEVKPGFTDFAPKNVLGDYDEQRNLEETMLNHIQWPRKEIDFIDEIPQAPPRAINVALQPVTLSLPQQLSRASPEEPNTRNPTADASTCDQPARRRAVQAMSLSAPEQPVARPTTAEDAPPV